MYSCRKILLPMTVAALVSGCSRPANESELQQFGARALAQIGPGATLLGVCGPFSGPASNLTFEPGKLVALVEQGDNYHVVDPFVLVSHPPVTSDDEIVAVDQNGNEIPQAETASNVTLNERTTNVLGSDSMRVTLYSVAANGVPDLDEREVYALDKGVFGGFAATVQIAANGRTANLTAECSR